GGGGTSGGGGGGGRARPEHRELPLPAVPALLHELPDPPRRRPRDLAPPPDHPDLGALARRRAADRVLRHLVRRRARAHGRGLEDLRAPRGARVEPQLPGLVRGAEALTPQGSSPRRLHSGGWSEFSDSSGASLSRIIPARGRSRSIVIQSAAPISRASAPVRGVRLRPPRPHAYPITAIASREHATSRARTTPGSCLRAAATRVAW